MTVLRESHFVQVRVCVSLYDIIYIYNQELTASTQPHACYVYAFMSKRLHTIKKRQLFFMATNDWICLLSNHFTCIAHVFGNPSWVCGLRCLQVVCMVIPPPPTSILSPSFCVCTCSHSVASFPVLSALSLCSDFILHTQHLYLSTSCIVVLGHVLQH